MNLDIDKYKEAIETVKWLSGEMSAEDLEKFPLIAGELDVIRQRLDFIFKIKNS